MRDLGGGRVEVVYRDAAYETLLRYRAASPFRYRFVLEGDQIVSHGPADRR